ncbi:AfsR/SARP family transcriptional regulator [Actinokineospora pegani]|uniref:AfsR/SARP family transcriptional regulator n=1 Tax=Actinokineospora pegani TaxID=2654637 RepID=UPI0018D3D1C4|nr:AfsR/SARP family transcriptional regulator [Actinokineospora pegani]
MTAVAHTTTATTATTTVTTGQDDGGPALRVRVLGLLEATRAGRSVLPTAAKPRQVFALLALRVGEVVPVAALVEELWGERRPPSARTTLQTYIKQLRKLIGPGAAGVLATRYGGYLLDLPAEAVDVHDYERLARSGRRAAEAGDAESAARLLRSALEAWRGPALVDVPTGESLAIELTRLEESRLSVVEARIDAEMRCGRHSLLLSELAALTARYPMNENLCAQHMLALFRSGRQWQALDAYQGLRAKLSEELGVSPSRRVRELQHAILTADARLDQAQAGHLQRLLV